MPLYPCCLHCGTKLSNPDSMWDGFGPICAAKIKGQQTMIDGARRAFSDGSADADLRAAVLCLERREGILLRYTHDETVSDLHAHQLVDIRKKIATKVNHRLRQGRMTLPEPEFSVAAEATSLASSGLRHLTGARAKRGGRLIIP